VINFVINKRNFIFASVPIWEWVSKIDIKTQDIKGMAEIIIKHGEIQQLANLFKVSRRTVYNALNTNRQSDLCKQIRKVALERGGLEVKPIKRQK
jgi:DeoR/GlpR family transcriptional regulator of sugar metabolism